MRTTASNRDLAIRPLGLGEIVDRAVSLTIRHFRPLFLWMLLLQSPAIALSRLQLAGTGELLATFGDPPAALAAARELSRTSIWIAAALFLLQFVATALCAAVVAPSLVAGAGLEIPPTRRRVAAVATAALASLLLFVLLPAIAALPGLAVLARARSAAAWVAGLILLVGGALGALLLTVLRTLLAPSVGAVEGRLHFSALLRSAALMRSAGGVNLLERPAVRASLVLVATSAIALAVSVVVGIPRGIIGRAASGSALLPGTLSLWVELPLALFETVASAALQPFSLVAVTVLYFDRRARREGLDLDRFAADAEARG